MVRVIEQYQCGICKAVFGTKANAEACEVETREADEEAGMEGYRAKELALRILQALGARQPVQ